MLLEDTPDNGKPKAGALLARRDIRLAQPRAAFLRQADAIVDDTDDDVLALARNADRAGAAAELFWRHRGDRLGRILDQVGERLRFLVVVVSRRYWFFSDLNRHVDVGMAVVHL